MHIMQGQTIKTRLGIYLAENVFAHGQLYTGILSREETPRTIRVYVPPSRKNFIVDPVTGITVLYAYTKNVVSKL